MAKNKNEQLPAQNQVASQLPTQQPPEPPKAQVPELPKAQVPELPKAQEPEHGMSSAEKAKAELERRKSESQARAVKKDVISTEPIYRSRTEK